MNSSRIVRFVRMTFQFDEVQTFLDLYAQIRTGIASFEGCEKLELWQDTTHPNIFTTYSLWQSEKSLEKYRQSAFFKENWGKTKALFQVPAVAFSYKELDIV